MPPLRERLEDLSLLVDHLRQTLNDRFHKRIGGISNEVLSRFMDHSWPGNIREREHVMEHGVVLCHGEIITINHLPDDIRSDESVGRCMDGGAGVRKRVGSDDILNALIKTGGNKAKAARLLKIGRRMIYRKIESYQIRCE